MVCFALGTWVGGMFTASCCRHLAAKGYPITLVTPGNDVAEILRVVTALAPGFDTVVLLGYPPFLNGVIDAGRVRGVSWSDYRVRLVLAGEVFSEQWRDLVGQRTGGTRPCYDSASLYGTTDAGVLANETPLSIMPSWPSTRTPHRSCSVSHACPHWPSTNPPAGTSRPTRAPCCSPGTRFAANGPPIIPRRQANPDGTRRHDGSLRAVARRRRE